MSVRDVRPRNLHEPEPREERFGRGGEQVHRRFAKDVRQVQGRRREARSDPLAVDAVIDNERPEQGSVRVDLERRTPYHAAIGPCDYGAVEMVGQAIDRQLCCGQQLQNRWPVLGFRLFDAHTNRRWFTDVVDAALRL